MDKDQVHDVVKSGYAEVARRVRQLLRAYR